MAMYSFRHLFIIFVFIILPILWAFNFKKSSRILNGSLFILFVLELFRVIFLFFTNDFHLNEDLSFQLCFTYSFIGIFYLIFKRDFILDYLGPFGILFGLAAIILTDPNPFFSFTVIDCYIYHSLLLFIGVYIVRNFKLAFSFKGVFIFWFQVLIAYIANMVIGHGANYIFLNTFLRPSHSLNYCANIEAFNIPFFNGVCINDILIGLTMNIGYFYYVIFLILCVTVFIVFWLKFFSKKFYI